MKQPKPEYNHLSVKTKTMKTSLIALALPVVLFLGCEKIREFPSGLTDGFCIVVDNQVVLNQHDFDFYDYSTHLIYMKEHMSFSDDIADLNGFSVYANRKEIYSGQVHPMYSSSFTVGPTIRTMPSGFGDYILAIDFVPVMDANGNPSTDLREDTRIAKALKKYNQYHAGLSCEIKSVRYTSSSDVKVELLLQNHDAFSYYYLDPVKTGTGLFHYFTNGIHIWDHENQKFYNHKLTVTSPDPWNSWEKEWLSVIPGNGQKLITLIYTQFEEIPAGTYQATFQFPGLTYQVKKEELQQRDGQIWLGKIDAVKQITIE
jgi:hypothetical protein